MKSFRVTPFLVALALLCAALPFTTQDAMAQEGAEMALHGADPGMEAFVKAISPAEAHEYLARYAGTWSYTSTMWQAPGQDPIKSLGTAVKTMIMGGRYLQEEMTGEMMGQPFTGRGLTGYNNITQGYVGTWIDNFGTGIIDTHGDAHEDKGSHTMRGEFVSPMTSATETLRMVTRIVDEDRHVFEYYVMTNGNEVKQMEIEYVRQK